MTSEKKSTSGEEILTHDKVVFIGQDLDKVLIDKTLKEAELTDKEWAQWEKVSRCLLTPTLRGCELITMKVMKSKKSEEKKVQRLYDLFDGEKYLAP